MSVYVCERVLVYSPVTQKPHSCKTYTNTYTPLSLSASLIPYSHEMGTMKFNASCECCCILLGIVFNAFFRCWPKQTEPHQSGGTCSRETKTTAAATTTTWDTLYSNRHNCFYLNPDCFWAVVYVSFFPALSLWLYCCICCCCYILPLGLWR